MPNTYLDRTFVTPTSNKKFTISLWAKRGKVNTSQALLQSSGLYFYFNGSANTLDFETGIGRLNTDMSFTDTAAWYHIVVAADTSLSTADNRIRVYINGVEQTEFANRTNPSQDATFTDINAAAVHRIGRRHASPSNDMNLEGCLAHYHFTDGYVYGPTDFGEFDSTSGIWIPKTSPSVTYGNNGFFLKFEDNSNLGLDSSGQSHNWTANGDIRKLIDTPTNNLTTLSPLYTLEYNSSLFVSNGNTTANSNTTQWNTVPCTLAVSKGKWYFEGYGHTNANHYVHYGITSAQKMNNSSTQAQAEINANANGYAYSYYGNSGRVYYSTASSGGQDAAYGNSYGSSDYIGIFADLDNNKIYFSKNGTLQNSGTGYDIHADGKPYLLATAVYSGLTNINFGNGLFGTTALTGTTYADANGHGVFKYSPNQGGASNFDSSAKNFYALNTKNLSEFGG